MDREEQIKKWQESLEKEFSHNGIVGGRFLARTIDEEVAAGGAFVAKYLGFRVLTDSFVEFFGETLVAQITLNNKIGWPQDRPYYVTVLFMYLTMFRTARAAEVLAGKGHLLPAYSMLRGLKDQVWVMWGLATDSLTAADAFGWEGADPTNEAEYQRKIVNKRRSAEDRVRNKILGKDSILKAETVELLQRWEWFFNWEAHRGLLSLFMSSKALMESKGQSFSLGPANEELNDAMYLTHANELNWMTLRLIPFMRRRETPQDEAFTRRWKLLDDSFKMMMDALGEMGKKIAPGMLELMNAKFKLGVDLYYVERAKGQSAHT